MSLESLSCPFLFHCFFLFNFFFLGLDLNPFVFDVQTQAVIDAHVLICHPHEREERHQIAPPVLVEKLEAGDDQKQCGNVVAEAVFAGEKVKKLAAKITN